jgi:hypothetical protein
MTKSDWLYGDAGDRIPVTPGTLWAAGPHLFACGDLTIRAQYAALLNPARLAAIQIPLVYVDPPWNLALLNGFRTKAGLSRSSIDFTTFLKILLEPLSTLLPRPTILMEGSAQPKAMEAVTDAVDSIRGLSCQSIWNITYYGDKPGLLYQLSGHPPEDETTFHGVDSDDCPGRAIEHFTEPGNFVLDPCVGRGGTAIACQTLSRRCIGMELNPRRLAVTLDRLHKDHDLRIDPSGDLVSSPVPTGEHHG